MSLTFLHHLTCNGSVNLRSIFLLSKNIESNMVRPFLISRKYVARGGQESSSSSGSSSDDSSSSDEEDNKKSIGLDKMRENMSSEKTHQTLNTLLQSMVQRKGVNSSDTGKKKVELGEEEPIIPKEFGKIEAAAKGVAESLGGDVKKTESELLNRLISRGEKRKPVGPRKSTVNLSELIVGMQIDRSPSSSGVAYRKIQRIMGEQPTSVSRKKRPTPPRQQPSFEEGEVTSTSEKIMMPRRDRNSVTASLLSDSSQERDSTTPRTTGDDNSVSASLLSQAEPPSRSIRFQSQGDPARVDLFGGDPLGIFSVSMDFVETPTLQTWQYLQDREMRLAITHPPSNYFEEMIQWTEKGMLWKFPINNEDGLVNEADVPFSEHVFLEKHLVPWCPAKGPIRHFMELVCVGLSKNPYITVEDKKAHILWYKEYFVGKSDLLKSVGITMPSEEQVKTIEGKTTD